MTTSTQQKTCPKCQSPIPSDAPGGLCPKCVLAGISTTAPAQPRPGTGDVPSIEQLAAIFPQLEIIELIGRGGMGFVFKARQLHLDREVALKLLPAKFSTDPHFAERFTREARVLAKLNHPNIVMVHDFGFAGGFYYLTMEYVEGLNLRQAMRMGKFSPAEALAIVPKICDALQFAHEQGVLHRDIKPENLLLDVRGRVKIADFGIAKLVGEESTSPTLTGTGASLGTPHYMAPEQFENPSQVDHRADIYSLGVVFYEMLTGELPLGRFSAPSARTDLDERIDAIVLRALARERDLRQKDARELQTQVEGITNQPAREQPPGTTAPSGFAGVWARHRSKFAWSTAALVFLLLCYVILVQNMERRRLLSEYYAATQVSAQVNLPDPQAQLPAIAATSEPALYYSATNTLPEDPEKLRREEDTITFARERYEAAKAEHSKGEISDRDLAVANRDLTIAEARGDKTKIALAQYDFVVRQFEEVRKSGDPIKIFNAEQELNKAQHAIQLAGATNELQNAHADLKYAERTLGAAQRLQHVRIAGQDTTTNLISAEEMKKLENAWLYAEMHYKRLKQNQPSNK
jgi:serine/threonine protein kinase